jgi:uncharacterized short protein YbdD (DUF466 family)
MVTNKKEIVYNNIERFAVIVATGEYRGVKYVCLNQGKHPSCYVMCSQEFLDKHLDKTFNTIDGLHVHGGITYAGMADKLLGLEDYDSPCFGWDYGHAGDWAGYISEEQNQAYGHTKYTTDMLIKDCENAIDQYLAIQEKDTQVTEPNPNLTKDLLFKLGFTPMLNGIDDALRLEGNNDGKKWKIYIDLNTPSWSYVINQNPRRKYEGEITTLDDLKSIIQLFDLPVDLSKF